MPSTIISDASCFVLLDKIDSLQLLAAVYGSVVTTPEVQAEVRLDLPDWVTIQAASSQEKVKELAQKVDLGEASAIALALEIPHSTLILDDLGARKLAENLGLEITGTVGVILKAKTRNLIPAVAPLLKAIRKTNFRLSPRVEAEALILAGETLE